MFALVRFAERIGSCLVLISAASFCSLAQTGAGTGAADRDMRAPSAQSDYTPLTGEDRLHDYVAHLFSPETFLRSAAGAGISQALNTPSEWGQGAVGYGRRYANSYGQTIIRSTLMFGSSSLLHEDNRYYLSGQTGFGPRFKYALTSTFLARHDDGSRHLSFSRVGSYVATAFISRAWQPPSTGGSVNAASALAVAFGADVGFNVAREFFPRIFRSHRAVEVDRSPTP